MLGVNASFVKALDLAGVYSATHHVVDATVHGGPAFAWHPHFGEAAGRAVAMPAENPLGDDRGPVEQRLSSSLQALDIEQSFPWAQAAQEL